MFRGHCFWVHCSAHIFGVNKRVIIITVTWQDGWMDGWLGFNGILSTQVAAISCLRKFKVCY